MTSELFVKEFRNNIEGFNEPMSENFYEEWVISMSNIYHDSCIYPNIFKIIYYIDPLKYFTKNILKEVYKGTKLHGLDNYLRVSNIDLLINFINNCTNNIIIGCFFIYFYIGRPFNHMNGFIVNKKEKILFRYEPNSIVIDYNEYYVDFICEIIAGSLGYSYKKSINFCPLQIIESKSSASGESYKNFPNQKRGYCAAWSLIFMHAQLLFPEMTQQELYDLILSIGNPNELSNIVREYNNFLRKLNIQYSLKQKVFKDIRRKR